MKADWISTLKSQVGFTIIQHDGKFGNIFQDVIGELIKENPSTVVVKFYNTDSRKYELYEMEKP